jgi:hypothetical protein
MPLRPYIISSRRERTSSFAVASTPTEPAFSSMDSLELTVKVAASCKSTEAVALRSSSLMASIFMIRFSMESSSKFALVIVINKLLSAS